MTSTTLPTSAPNISGRAWVLAVLTLTYTFNHVDRQILVILLEPIKAEFGLSDGQVGWLTGLSFAAFYATLGIPVAMWADRGNRRNIISLALGVWSAMTALSGLAQNFWQLLLARVGVAVGELGRVEAVEHADALGHQLAALRQALGRQHAAARLQQQRDLLRSDLLRLGVPLLQAATDHPPFMLLKNYYGDTRR